MDIGVPPKAGGVREEGGEKGGVLRRRRGIRKGLLPLRPFFGYFFAGQKSNRGKREEICLNNYQLTPLGAEPLRPEIDIILIVRHQDFLSILKRNFSASFFDIYSRGNYEINSTQNDSYFSASLFLAS